MAVVEARQRQIVSETAADSFILDLHCHSLIALSLLHCLLSDGRVLLCS